MKLNDITLLLLFAIPFIGCAQTNACLKKTHAYSRSVLGGAAPIDPVEVGGKVIKSQAANNKEFFVYLQTCDVNTVSITSVWINGLRYSGRAEKTKSPVVLTNTSLSTKGISETLVDKTNQSVWEVVLTSNDSQSRPATSVQKKIDSNALVIRGILNGKAFTASSKQIKELQPVAMQ